jgi:cystathionine beta-synthase
VLDSFISKAQLTQNLQFVDDDWLAANDLLPPTPPITPSTSNAELPKTPSSPTTSRKDPFAGATVASLRLKPLTSIAATAPCSEAIETMRDKGFDQLPVSQSNRLVGLVTLGNLLSAISRERAAPSSPVSTVMFDFGKLPAHNAAWDMSAVNAALEGTEASSKQRRPRRSFVEITRKTPLAALSRFFEWNSAAVVTEREEQGDGKSGLKPIAIVTKVDLLSWLVRQGKN